MPTLNGNDIVFVFSGGGTNDDPDLSIGGDPSIFTIPGGINNLFSDVSQSIATSGGSDYRAFYVFNNSTVATFFNVEIYISNQAPFGSDVAIGLPYGNEVQEIRIPQTTTSGSADMDFDGTIFTWNFDPDLAVWGQNLQDAMNLLDGMGGVEVSVSVVDGDNVFTITFDGDNANRNYPLLEVDANNYAPGPPDITITEEIEGGPINAIIDSLPVDTVAPAGIVFEDTSSDTPLLVGNMLPLDGFPVWVRRTTASGTQPIENDNVQISLRGRPF
jgi:hypothetical protein